MEAIKRYHLFFIDKEKDTNGKYRLDGRLRARVTWNKNKVDFNLGYRVELSKWDASTQRVKKNSFNLKKIPANTINSEIQKMDDLINEIFYEFEIKNIIPSPVEFRSLLNKKQGKINQRNSANNIFDDYKLFIELEGVKNSWSFATKQQHLAVIGHLKAFYSDLKYTDLNDSNLVKFVDFLINRADNQQEDEEAKQNLQNSSIDKVFRFFRAFLKWSLIKGINDNPESLKFKTSLKMVDKQKVLYLTDEELEKVKNIKFTGELTYLDRTRDVFLFQCATAS